MDVVCYSKNYLPHPWGPLRGQKVCLSVPTSRLSPPKPFDEIFDHGHVAYQIKDLISRPANTDKGGRALRGFGPLWSQKLKVAFYQFHPIGLLEEWSKCKILVFILLFPLLW